ncbi:MAG: hypothetical protein QXD13_00140 [Candidatus Pacearchaeota archaeon]
MTIEKIYLGVWFQRTSIHLKEIYNFIKYRKTLKILEEKKIKEYWNALKVREAGYYEEKYFDYVEAKCGNINLSLTEDGVMLSELPKFEDVKEGVKEIEDFYINNFAPAISYLFSKGAPLPKDLLRMQEAYPLYLVGRNLKEKEAIELLNKFGDRLLSHVSSNDIGIVFGERIGIINIRDKGFYNDSILRGLLQNIVFFREFERQLKNYLHLHRDMWEKISEIRNGKALCYKDVKEARDRLLNIAETLSFVRARMRQMKDIIAGRNSSISSDMRKQLVLLGIERFNLFKSDVEYLEHLWETTIDYANSTLMLINSIFDENTQRELNALRFITLIGVIVGFFGMNIAFPWEERWSAISHSSWVVFALIIAVAIVSYQILKIFIYNRRFALHGHEHK